VFLQGRFGPFCITAWTSESVKNIGVYMDDFGEILFKGKGFTHLESVVDTSLT
jgi:hypothetical protein